jgi:hypothetical protein
MMDESSFVKTRPGEHFRRIERATQEVDMTAARTVSPHDPAQSDLIRYFDGDLVTVDRFTIESKARRERAALMGELIREGAAWLRQRVTHFGETRSPVARCYVDHVQF